ncbi:MAG: nucleotidyltransferase domain-containing protein [Xenococcaceae cyanobacterium MO_207.B15]|nr:nucleotidyltransferase domain-containing protein [Xenococcaceae cyanobacterium MO_207.B15]
MALKDNIGLFNLREFMGALNFQGEKFRNFLGRDEKSSRISLFHHKLEASTLLRHKCNVYLYGSYLRKKVFNDIDILIVYEDFISSEEVDSLIEEVQLRLSDLATKLHFQCCAKKEFKQLRMRFDNKQKVF